MKHYLFFFIAIFSFVLEYSAQDMDKKTNLSKETYSKDWKEVYNFESKGLPKSALEKVALIYKQAKKDSNSNQIIKSILYKVKFIGQVEEDAFAKAIQEFQKELNETTGYPKLILHSMLGEIYWQYYLNNKYYIVQRSATKDFKPSDLNTWDAKRIIEESIYHFLESSKNIEMTQSISLDEIEPLLNYEGATKPDGRNYRPTVYDFLAHRAIDFFAGQEHELTKPADTFILNKKEYFSPASEFVASKIESNDSLAQKFHALKLLQDLTQFHIKTTKPEILVDIELKRLSFVFNHSVLEDKILLYRKSLESLSRRYSDNYSSTEISAQSAQSYLSTGSNIDILTAKEENKKSLAKAYDICELAIKKFPNSLGAGSCRNIQTSILSKTLRLSIEKVNLPNQPLLGQIEFKNLDKIYFRVYKVNREMMEQVRKEYFAVYKKLKYYESYDKVLNSYFINKKPSQTFSINLPKTKDFNTHKVEFEIPSLDLGQYLILSSLEENFNYNKNAFGFAFTTVSKLVSIHSNDLEGTAVAYVLDRETGKPISNAEVSVYTNYYDNKLSRYVNKKLLDKQTDKNGFFRYFGPKNSSQNFFLKIKKDNDLLEPIDDFYSVNDYYYSNLYTQRYNQNEEAKHTVSKLFFDRSIYRPGQTIYFKGLLIDNLKEKRNISPNTPVTVTFYNTNYIQVSSLNLVTNEFGSFSGTFTAPIGGLNGRMSIQTNYGESATIMVEEYKRPKFKVEFDELKGSYKLGDVVKVKGFGKAFSGANIDNAEVKYRVTRKAIYPYWWYYRFGYYPNSNEMEITNGKSSTNEKGEFIIDFTAIPDLSIEKNPNLSFQYRISVDITDLNGETQSSTQSMNVGYTSLKISTDIPEILNSDSKKEFNIKTTNLNDVSEPAIGYITIHRLQPYSKALRQRKWSRSDLFLYSEEEFHKKFPYDIYDKEDEFQNWEKKEEVLNLPFNTEKEKKFIIGDLKKWKAGKYVLEMKSFDKWGEEVVNTTYFTHFSDSSTPYPSFLLNSGVKSSYEVGETLKLELASTETIRVFYEIKKNNKVLKTEFIEIDNKKAKLEFPIEESHRGGLSISIFTVNQNQFIPQSIQVNVPYSNKELSFEYETFRDKLQPGSEEEWRIKIKGPKAEKVTAEMLASLYDASLDQFTSHSWGISIYPYEYSSKTWFSMQDFVLANFPVTWVGYSYSSYPSSRSYDYLNWYGMYLYNFRGYYPYQRSRAYKKRDGDVDDFEDNISAGAVMDQKAMPAAPVSLAKPQPTRSANKKSKEKISESRDESYPAEAEESSSRSDNKPLDKSENSQPVKLRSDFRETAFFLPFLYTDKEGTVTIKFKLPDALTKWKFLTFAHTKDLKFILDQKEIIAQKDLMVIPNPPRFFREDDSLEFTAKITNLKDKDLTGSAQIEFYEVVSNKDITSLVLKDEKEKKFNSLKGQSSVVVWKISIPNGLQGLGYRIIAKADKFSDGEEMPLPVLTNRMLVTETLPIWVNKKDPKTFTLNKLQNNTSNTLVHHSYTLEYTSNPAWNAILALPYIMEYPYECAEQLFSRYYANSLATHIANSYPKIKKVFDTWRSATVKKNSSALVSNLEKNQELKNILLEETPWVLDSIDETERKRRVAVLFDLMKLSDEMQRAFQKLKKLQGGNGGFSWFQGMPENRYITQHIITGIGHLRNIKVNLNASNSEVNSMIDSGIHYLDSHLVEDYRFLLKMEKTEKWNLSDNHINLLQIQYLYTRSFFKEIPLQGEVLEAFEYFKWQTKTYWTSYLNHKIALGMIVLALHRFGETTPENLQKIFKEKKLKEFSDKKTSSQIVKSLKENSIHSEELGMYWKESWGYYWYELPTETQSLMIEVFSEVANDKDSVSELKTWLLKNKQTNDWKTTKATTDAIYSLLLKGDDWLQTSQSVQIEIGGKKMIPDTNDIEAGTGYFKKSFSPSEINKEMAVIKLTPDPKQKAKPSYGGVYWQYFENLDKITPAETPLKLNKKVFIEEMTKTGPVIRPIDSGVKLKVGDKLKIRIELRVDREMEYVHMKDMRASALEPLNVLSQYKWQDGLGYYESTKDTATNFFFDYLPKGTYVFEYPLRVTHKGNFSNGITQIQSMYAPEFASHSEGIRIQIE
jgi:uncharacterized protein YfaS (alpha-2-macroglobulin family)